MSSLLIRSVFKTPLGSFEVTHDEHFLFTASLNQTSSPAAENKLTPVIAAELDAYFSDPHHRFQLQLKPQGSLYQQKIWNALLVIPTGRTLTYGELALKLQSSPRAIGQACKKNPLAIFIPCHRVVGKNNLGGFMGRPEAVSYKEQLLSHENYL